MIPRIFSLINLTLLFLVATAQATEPRLVSWDIGTFHGEASSIAILDQGERFATVGSDRVIRIYNSTTGEVEMNIVGYADMGDGGAMHSLAASPDSKQLAVGVNFGGITDVILDRVMKKGSGNGGANFDRESGKLLNLLGGHTLPAYHVFYTNDGKYLITASQELLAWDTAALSGKGKPVEMIPSTSSRVGEVRLLWAAPAGSSGQSRILFARADNIRTLTLFEVPSRTYIASVKLPDTPVTAVARGDRIAITLQSGGVLLFDGELKQLAALAPDVRFKDIDLSGDAQRLIACAAAPPYGCMIGEREHGFALATDKPGIATERPFNPLFLNNKRLLLWAGDGELRLHQLPSGNEERRIMPRVPQVSGADLVGGSLLLSDGEKNSCRSFNIAGGTTAPCAAGEKITPELPRSWKGYEIRKVKSDEGKQEYAVAKGAFESSTLQGGDSDVPVGFLDNGLVAGASSFEGFIDIRTMSGSRIAEMIGHEGKITSIRQRGDLLITTATDRTVRLWDVSPLRGLPPDPLQIKVTGVQPGSVADKAGFRKGSSILAVNGRPFRTVADFRELVNEAGHFTLTVKDSTYSEKISTIRLEKPVGILGVGIEAAGEIDFLSHLRPFASLLVTGDGNWALWSEHKLPEKSIHDEPATLVRYAASAKGHDLLRWRINQGKEQEARLVPFERSSEYDATLP